MSELKYKDLISKLTLDEKAHLMTGKDFWQTLNIDRLEIPSIFLSDGPHGIRKQAEDADHLGLNVSIPATCFPTAATMACSWDEKLGEELGKYLGEEAVSQKVNVLLGPGTNIKRSPLCGRNFEYFSEDPILAGKMAASYIRGIQSKGISACVKHFACNNQEINRMTLDSIVDERTLREIYLTAFEIAVKEGQTKTIMSSYNLLNGIYANENKHLMVDILRNEWNYKGLVVTDWGGEIDRVEGLKCFNELEMPGVKEDTANDIIEAVKSGQITEELLDKNVDSLLNLVFETEKAYASPRKQFDVKEHNDFARKAAQESIVLLENKDNVLPLKKDDKVALIGDFIYTPRYQGAGSSIVNATLIEKVFDEYSKYPIDVVGIERGFKRYGGKSKTLLNKAINLAKKADKIVLYLGLDEVTEAEGLDRNNADLPRNQRDLVDEIVRLGKKVIVVLSCGSYVEIPFADKVDALVHGYLSGQASATAVLDVLTGKVNPSGKLAESYPYKLGDVASMDNFPSEKRTIEYREAYGVGYRYFEKANIGVLYPFGYGLSYTKFEYSNFKVNKDGVSVDVKNIGDIDGKEVVQLYVGLKNSKVIRPLKELKGFAKVLVKAGETVKVSIPFDDKTFRYFNALTNKWEIEDGNYDIYVGQNSRDIKFVESLKIKGTTNDFPYFEKDLQSYFEGKLRNISDNEFAKLLGHQIPSGELEFINKRKAKIIVDYNTTVCELRYAKGWFGRLFSCVIRFAIKALRFFGKKELANTLIMGVRHQPMRGLSRMTGGIIRWKQLDGLILMFNGRFYKGLNIFFKEGRKAKRDEKEKRKESL